ncbi:MAG: hypothetical protein H6921_10410 [Sphingomonas sp.]|nr:hypothetical protein [Sphingomonas sp.]
MGQPSNGFAVEPLDESGGHCDCCGEASRSVWGVVHQGNATVAAYWVHWTVGHLDVHGANLDLILGAWGDDTSARDRVAASLVYRAPEDTPPALMVIDAADRPIGASELVSGALRREEIIGTPLADHLFAMVDAIWEQDQRFF